MLEEIGVRISEEAVKGVKMAVVNGFFKEPDGRSILGNQKRENGSNENNYWVWERGNESWSLISFCRRSIFCRRSAVSRPTYIITCDFTHGEASAIRVKGISHQSQRHKLINIRVKGISHQSQRHKLISIRVKGISHQIEAQADQSQSHRLIRVKGIG
ncbi:hypothetical protein LXL04_038452 [Taraxacum kok-saghyz]